MAASSLALLSREGQHVLATFDEFCRILKLRPFVHSLLFFFNMHTLYMAPKMNNYVIGEP